MATLKQQTSFGPGIYRGHVFSADRLKAFVDGTNAAIKAGVPIPLLKRHAPINASDDDTVQFAKEEGSGWIKEVFIDDKGNIGFEADSVPAEDAVKANEGTLKYTSPEFRPHYECEKAGVYSGPVIRHFAFTPTPGNPHQGAIETIALTELKDLSSMNLEFKALQLSEEDFQGPVDSKTVAKINKEQFAELQPVEAPSINALQDSQYKSNKVKYPKHTEDTADNPDHDVNDLANGEGNSIDEEELVDEECKPKKKKGTTNKGEDVDHDQEMDKDTNKDVETQHSEPEGDDATSKVLEGHGWEFKGDGVFKHKSYPKHKMVYIGPHIEHHQPSGSKYILNDTPHLKRHLPKLHGSQHAEKDSDGFGKPKNDEPNAPAKQPPNDPNLEVMENPEAPIENAPPENPDMPPKATDKTKLSAIIAGLNQLGVVVPSDWDPCKDGSMDILLGCLNTHIKTEQDAEVEENAGQEEDVESPKDAPMPFSEENEDGQHHLYMKGGSIGQHTDARDHHKHGKYVRSFKSKEEADATAKRMNGRLTPGEKQYYGIKYHVKSGDVHGHQFEEEAELQFTEDELKAMPAKARKVIEAGQVALKAEREARIKAEQEAIAFAEQEKLTKAMAAKGKAIAEVQAVAIPPALKRQLLDGYQNLQFSEAQDQPLYTGEQVAKMVANALPPALQFMEIETAEGIRPSVSIPVGKDPNTGEVKYKQLHDSEQFFEESPSEFVMTKERANEIANATTARIQTHHHNVHTFTPTVPLSQMVASENQRVPNNVMNQ